MSSPNPTTTAASTPQAFNYQNWGTGANQQQALANTPGYQFTLGQGLNSVQNTNAANGRGVSGNSLAGAANYATGLANNTFNQQLQNSLTSQGQNFNQNLSGQGQQFSQAYSVPQLNASLNNQQYGQQSQNLYNPISALYPSVQLAQNSAAGVGSAAQNYATNAGNALTSGAAASAAGQIGAANSLSGGFNGASNSLLINSLLGGNGTNGNSNSLFSSIGNLFGGNSNAGFGGSINDFGGGTG